MEPKEYFDRLKNKRVLVLGLGVSNRPLVRLLLDCGARVIGCDRSPREKLDPQLLELEARGLELQLGEGYLDGLRGDVAFRTPGLHPAHPALQALRAAGTRITSEMDAFLELCPCAVTAVTGSDGKTTTSTLIARLLEQAGQRVWLGGNIGRPLLDQVEQMRPEDQVVLELSSFQLMDLQRRCHRAVVTNVAPNHLDVHKDMEEYVRAKANVFAAQQPEDLLILNGDNAITRDFAARARGRLRFFSRQQPQEQGLWFDGSAVRRRGEILLRREQILLPGLHNVENYMAAYLAVEELVSPEQLQAVAGSFGGVEHRIELVRQKDGVRYYNDSIASSPSRTVAGLRSFEQRLILIAGGYDKHIPYDSLGPEIARRVKLLISTGDTGEKIARATRQAENYRPEETKILAVEDFREAVLTAARLARPGDVVLLSPASAAFDRFPNFMVRGATFKQIVKEL